MEWLKEIKEGVDLGEKARSIFTELRLNNIDPIEADKDSFKHKEIVEKLRHDGGFFHYVGYVAGHLKKPLEWYRNSDYLFGDEF